MPELSLHVLDIAENSVSAGATEVRISVTADSAADTLRIVIADNGCGMTEEAVKKVTDPFYTTRTTRKVGLGVPFFKLAAEVAGGSFAIDSAPDAGTTVTATFLLSHIDRMPLGDMVSTMHTLITQHEETDFIYCFTADTASFTLDTKEMRELLDGVSFREAEVSAFIRSYLEEHTEETLREADIPAL